MWNPTTLSSDNKQEKEEGVNVEDCKCSGSIDELELQQKSNSKQQTSTFGGQLTGSTNIPQQQGLHKEIDDNKQLLNPSEETTDSGFISGPQTSSAVLGTDSEETSGIKKLSIPESSSESQQHNKTQQQEPVNLDSGIVEEEYDDGAYDLDRSQKSQSKESNMILPHNVESGISEWFCNLSLNNNPNATANSSTSVGGSGLNNLDGAKQQQQKTVLPYTSSPTAQQHQHQTATIPQQITPDNAWEKYYQQNDLGDTALHSACIYGNENVVAALIRMAPHPCLYNIQNDDAQTPLHLATINAQPKIIRMLLLAGAKPTVRDRYGNTALHLACKYGEEQCVRALTTPICACEVNEAHRQYGHRANDKSYLKYAQLPSDLELRNYDGENCVHLAAEAGFISILRILVLYGADINAREGKSGYTPLHIAIENCNEEMANFILDDCQTLNLETASYAGLTAYQVACLNKSEMVNILEKRGAELLTPPSSDYDSSDSEDDLKPHAHFGDPGYFVGYNGGNAMAVA